MNTVVYYPYIYPSKEWLKLAAICWDKVYRLAPANWSDPPEVKKLDTTLGGVLADIDIKNVTADEVKKHFGQWIDGRSHKFKGGESHAEVESHGLSSLRGLRPIFSETLPTESTLKEEEYKAVMNSLSTVYYSGGKGGRKISNHFIHLLEEHGLAQRELRIINAQIADWDVERYHINFGFEFEITSGYYYSPAEYEYYKLLEAAERKRFIGDIEAEKSLIEKADKIRQRHLITLNIEEEVIRLPKDIALHYLSLCASKAATEGKRDLLASSMQFTDSIFYSNEALRGEMAVSTLQAYLPRNFFQLEPQQIAEFRSKFAIQRLKYQKEIQSLTDEFSNVASEGELEKVKKSIMEIAKEQISETERMYKRAKLDIALSTLSVSLTPPALAASIASILGIGIFAPAGIAGALALFAAQALLSRRRAKSEMNQSPWSYVLDIAKKL